jgi:uncharacterized protein (UPF0218 family)
MQRSSIPVIEKCKEEIKTKTDKLVEAAHENAQRHRQLVTVGDITTPT